MAQEIPKHVASSVLSILSNLRKELEPFIADIVHKASTGGVDIAEHTAQGALDKVREGLSAIETKIKDHAPPGV